jgi:N-acetyltransferase
VAAATASAATASASAEAGLLGGAVSREHGELLPHVLGPAVRAIGVLPVPDELLEVGLALHADVLVDRHRPGSLGSHSDGPQMCSNGPMWPGLWVRLEGQLVVLEPLGREHEDGLRAAAADERVWSFMVTDDPELWLRATFAEAAAEIRAPFTVFVDGVAVGSTSYMSMAPEHLRLEIGSTWMNPATWGTGANVEAKYLLLRHAFEELGCRRVEFKTDANNERARGALAALPAEFEGIHRKHMLVRNGERRDSAWYSVIDDEWPAVKTALENRIKAASEAPAGRPVVSDGRAGKARTS